jgi:hypothetical protein
MVDLITARLPSAQSYVVLNSSSSIIGSVALVLYEHPENLRRLHGIWVLRTHWADSLERHYPTLALPRRI